MPELFGNTYILPAIIVVVLLILLLGVLALRKRGSGATASKTVAKTGRRVTPPPEAGARRRRAVKQAAPPAQPSAAPISTAAVGAAGPPAAERAAPAPAPEMPRGGPRPAPSGPATGAHGEALRMAAQADPLHAVIFDILQGWGDISDDDTKRLSLFRPEKVLAAVQTMEVPRELKSSQHARNRLLELRQYAAGRVEEQQARQAADASRTEPATAPEPSFEVQEAAPAETPAAIGQLPAAIFEAPPGQVEARPPIEPPVEKVGEIALEAVQETPFVASAAPPVEPAETEWPAAQPSWLQPDQKPAIEWQSAEAPLFLQEPEEPLPGLRGSVKTADELLALPIEEQQDMVTFLEPPELAKVFERTDDPNLKRAIIDTLEHVSNPASLDVLRRCLDDPDPQIQLYALEAADRLLGVD